LEEYARQHNHGQTIYVRVPTGGVLGEFTAWLAMSLRISPQLKQWQIKDRIINAFDERMLLIVDEAHECFSSHYSDRGVRTLNFCREIHDRKRCGLVIAGTEVLEENVQAGKHRQMLRQLGLRSLAALKLPPKPSAANLVEFARRYNLPPAEGEALTLQTEIIREHGLGKWCSLLMAASRIAAKEKKEMGWSHVIKAHAAILALEAGQ
jgi:hypothetical protein